MEEHTRQWAQSFVLYSALMRRPQIWHVLWLHGAMEWWATGLAQMKQTSASSSSSGSGAVARAALFSLIPVAGAATPVWPAASGPAAEAESGPFCPRPWPRLPPPPLPPRLAPRFWPWFPLPPPPPPPPPPPRPRPLEPPSLRPVVVDAPSALDMVDACDESVCVCVFDMGCVSQASVETTSV